MNRHIEQTDRGIVISKNLAWTMGVALVTGGMWLGTNVATMKSSLTEITSHVERSQARADAFDLRINQLERSEARIETQLLNQTKLLERIDARVSELNTRIRVQESDRP